MSLNKENQEVLKKIRESLVKERNTQIRNTSKVKQDRAKELLGVPDREIGSSSQEEFWNSPIRFEVKSGNQVEDNYRKFAKAETQSYDYAVETNETDKPFVKVDMPNQTNDGLFICRLSELKNVVAKLQDMWKEGDTNGMD